MAEAEMLKPVNPSERVGALDAVRGLAILGIFLVNIQGFKAPLGQWFEVLPLPTDTVLDQIVHFATRWLAEGKFYPLFSMLFGMGLAMQCARAERAGRSFRGFAWRRLLVLFMIGVPHALLLWYGDILIIYSVVGFVAIWFIHARASTLATVGGAMLALSVLFALAFGLLGAMSPPPESPQAMAGAAGAAEAAASGVPVMSAAEGPEGGPLRRYIELMSSGARIMPNDSRWMALELEAYQHGPARDLVGFRAVTYLSMVLFWMLLSGGFFHVLSMFCFGAALLKAGIFDASRRAWWVRLLALGAVVGVPLAALFAFTGTLFGEHSLMTIAIAPALNYIAGPLISLGYLGAIALLAHAAPGAWVVRGLSAVGRLALTNYLLQSLVAATLMTFWGLSWFGTVSRSEGAMIVVVVYAAQVALSLAWLRLFRIGPMEWIWRSAAYLRPQPLRGASRAE